MIVQHYDTREYLYPIDRKTLSLKLMLQTQGEYHVSVIYWKRFHEDKTFVTTMQNLDYFNKSPFYYGSIKSTEPIHYIRYYFKITNGNETRYYSPWGISEDEPGKYFEYTYVNVNDVLTDVPSFVGRIGYHLFLDRFCNGDQTNDPENKADWDDQPTRENSFGGDIAGLRKKLSYLRELGIDAVFLLPVFKASFNHKYDTLDYFSIDPAYGTLAEFKELVQEIHQYGMKIILDGVFNHIGFFSPIFQDVVKHGKQSQYYHWFLIHGDEIDLDDINYECVGDYRFMPKLNFQSVEVREYFLKVGKYWITETDIDGWRLDVADEIDFTFWHEFRKQMKALKDVFLVSETWKDGKDMLRGDQMDSIMNYRWREAVLDYLGTDGLSHETFKQRLNQLYFDYPRELHSTLYNHLSSHDTPRALNVLGHDLKRQRLALVLQMTLPGMPIIYYGDEIGMDGENDPDNRKTMKWDSINQETLSLTKKLVILRKREASLREGSFQSVSLVPEIYSFIRRHGNTLFLILVNRNQESIDLKFDPAMFFQPRQESSLTMIRLEALDYKIIKIVNHDNAVELTIK